MNPGPIRFPCTVCYRPVKYNDRALLCDMCKHWICCRCGVSVVDWNTKDFQILRNLLGCVCLAMLAPFLLLIALSLTQWMFN